MAGKFTAILISTVLLGLVLLLPRPVQAENGTDLSVLTFYNGQIVDSIVIEPRNIFDTNDPRYSGFIFKSTNRLHIVTRAAVIRRELLLAEGKPFSAALAEETARNLRSGYAIYDAWTEVEPLPNGHLLVRLITIDQWSLTGGFTISKSGSETDYEFGFEENNFFGWNQYVAAEYVIQNDDDNFFRGDFRDRRFLGQAVRLGLYYSDNPLNEYRSLTVSHPYYNLGQQWAYGFSVSDRGSRRDLYDDGNVLVGQSRNTGDVFTADVEYRWGEYARKTGVFWQYDYRYESTYDRRIAVGLDPATLVFPRDSLVHLIQGGVSWENLNFMTTRRISGFGIPEDITLGQTVRLKGGRGFTAGLSDYVYDKVELVMSASARSGSSIFMLSYNRAFWYRGSSEFRRFSNLQLTYYNNRLERLTLAFRGMYTRDWRSDNSARMILGGSSGLRGYSKYFRTGDRLMVFNAETRVFPRIEFLSVLVGGVAFVDVGRTWKATEAFRFRDFYAAFGVGLRLSLEKASKNRIIRVDVSLDENDSVQWTFGTGQYF